MKRNKEIYKVGRLVMNTARVPMKRNGKVIRYKSSATRIFPKAEYSQVSVITSSSSNSMSNILTGYTTGHVSVASGELRTKRPNNYSEFSHYYGSAVSGAIAGVVNSLRSSRPELKAKDVSHNPSNMANSDYAHSNSNTSSHSDNSDNADRFANADSDRNRNIFD